LIFIKAVEGFRHELAYVRYERRERLETKFSNAERAESWDFIKSEFAEDWNSLVIEVSAPRKPVIRITVPAIAGLQRACGKANQFLGHRMTTRGASV
jgi:hypothetical protein